MIFIVSVLSTYVFMKTLGYAIYEYTDNKNKPVAIMMGLFAFISLIGPIVIELLR